MEFHITINQIATVLLIGRLISTYYVLKVIHRQKEVAKKPLRSRRVAKFRSRLQIYAKIILIGNIIPIILDASTIIAANNLNREDSPSVVGVAYAFNNCITFILFSVLLWSIYKEAYESYPPANNKRTAAKA